MKSFLRHVEKKVVDNSIVNNIPNGNDAEVFAASNLLQAIGCEISWGSRNEDGRKIDLICSFDHPWITNERAILLVQIKSGYSFGVKHGKGFKLKAVAKSAALRTSHSICVIWVDRNSNDLFWAYIHSNSVKGNQIYGEQHTVTPALIFDLARCQAQHLPIKKGGKGIIINTESKDIEFLRKQAIEKYTSFQVNEIISPVLGRIECTRLGWRHMFRKTRSKAAKDSSLKTIPIVKSLLEDNPSSMYVSFLEQSELDDYVYRQVIYVLHYDEVKFQIRNNSDDRFNKVVIKVIEEIRWPKFWRQDSVLSQRIDRVVKIQSCYYK